MTIPKYGTIGAKLVFAFSCSTFLLMVVSVVAWLTWSSLDSQVNTLLGKSVPKFNASYVLESHSAEIRSRIEIISNAQNKVVLDEQLLGLNEDLAVINTVLSDLEINAEQQRLRNGYVQLRNSINHFVQLVSKRIDQKREVELLQEQIQWIDQDIRSELIPLRQEIQWQLERGIGQKDIAALLTNLKSLQAVLDSKSQVFIFVRELLIVKHSNQVDNGMKVLQYRLEELKTLSEPIFSQPSSIAYQQQLTELLNVLTINGPFHRHLRSMVILDNQLGDIQKEIQEQVSDQHNDIALLVENADSLFVQIKKETTELVSNGSWILLACFSLSILMSLLLTYYFIYRRIIFRLNNLSKSLDAIIHHDLSHPIIVDGDDEIGQISEKLIQYGNNVEEMERTNALSLINNTQASLITCNLFGEIESANINARESLNIEKVDEHKALWLCFPHSLQVTVQQLFNQTSKLTQSGADSITLSLGNDNKPYYVRIYLRQYTHGLHEKIIVTITDVTDQELANRILEERVKEKTQSLREKNHQLLAEIDERHRAELSLKTTQNDLVQAAKMAVVGQTMTSLAHELNQPLSAMSTYIYSSKLALENKQIEQVKSSVQQIENLTERMGKMINSLRHFSRKTNTDEPLKPVLMVNVLEQVMLLTQSKTRLQQVLLNNHIHEPIEVIADHLGLEQVLINLIVNGCEAVLTQDKKRIDIIYLHSNSTHHTFAVCDSGDGFSHDVVDKLFTPFTTTKEVGLGLGLNICQSLIEKMAGHIYLASTLEGGAMIILELSHA